MVKLTNEQIIARLTSDLDELIPIQAEQDVNDGYGDYLAGIIDRSQTVLRMMGVDESLIPNDGSC